MSWQSLKFISRFEFELQLQEKFGLDTGIMILHNFIVKQGVKQVLHGQAS